MPVPPVLRPLSGIEPDGPVFRATLPEPWFSLAPGRPVAGRWIEIRYRAGRLQDPVRPLLRLDGPSGPEHRILPGPVAGGARWVGPIPPDAVALALSPVAAPGPFSFAVDSVRPVGRAALVAGAFRRNPGLTLNACWQRVRGRKVRARHFLASIWASTPFDRYPAWLRARSGLPALPEPAGPPPPRFAVRIAGQDPEAAARTRASLAAQTVPVRIAADGTGWGDADWVGTVAAGDTVPPDAFAICAAAIARDPALDLLYADEDRRDGAGRPVAPVFKPGWSPRLAASAGLLDGFVLVRTAGLPDGETLARRALGRPDPRVGAVRRVLLHRAGPAPRATPPAVPNGLPAGPRSGGPLVTAVIPNRDSLPLLRVCLAGMRERTNYPDREIVIVDNGSERAETRAFYAEIARDPAVTILERPGPFNFSYLTNQGAAVARGQAILMLNNDIEVIRPDWLDRMVDELAPPDVAAVGAKLLYPDGRVQHAGVAIGLGGAAGHVYRARADRPDAWAGRLTHPHEVSAVTGACCLVRRTAYEAVGGLEEDLFPVSFNDIDLCLKLRREGWRVILTPEAVLYHHESASRGRDVGPKQARAAREAAAFAARWRGVMRDDPYFHPGLSLMRFDVELG